MTDADELGHGAARRPSRRLWGAAGLAAILIHASAFGAFWFEQPAEANDDVGAPAIEVGIELASVRAEQTDLPPGPESEANAASAAAVEVKQTVTETELPKAVPTETEDPDRIVTTASTAKPKEEDPVSVAIPTPASQESVASDATAAPTIEAAQAPVTTAPVIGNGESTTRVRAEWQKRLVTHLDHNKRYPATIAHKNREVRLTFTLDRTGRVLTAAVVNSSGDAAFDEAALAMMQRADPVPAPPPLIADDGLTFTVPVLFRNKGKS